LCAIAACFVKHCGALVAAEADLSQAVAAGGPAVTITGKFYLRPNQALPKAANFVNQWHSRERPLPAGRIPSGAESQWSP